MIFFHYSWHSIKETSAKHDLLNVPYTTWGIVDGVIVTIAQKVVNPAQFSLKSAQLLLNLAQLIVKPAQLIDSLFQISLININLAQLIVNSAQVADYEAQLI